MKPPSSRFPRSLSSGCLSIHLAVTFSLACASSAQAVNLYWDINGTDPNTGATGSGTWNDSNTFWNDDATGTGGNLRAATTSADDLFFSSGSGLTAGTITVASGRTAGTITFEESGIYTLNGGNITLAGLTFNNGTGANVINSALVLGSAATFRSDDDSNQTITGGITGTASLSLQANSTGNLTFSTGAINHAGTLTNEGTGTGTVTINSQIGANVTSVIQNSTTSRLAIFGAGGVAGYGNLTVKAGTVEVRSNSTTPIAASAQIILGDTVANAADVTLIFQGSSATFTTPISLASGTTGKITIGGMNTGTAINVNSNITGTNNFEISNALGASANTSALNFSTGEINHTGTLTNVTGGTSTNVAHGMVVINSVIGSNVTGVIQNSASANRVMRLNGNNTYVGETTVTNGTLAIGHNNALGSTAGGTSIGSAGVLRLHDNITVTGEALTINGSSSGNALVNGDGNNVWAGTINANVVPGNVRIASGSGHLEIRGNVTISGNSSSGLVLTGTSDGEISGNIGQSGTGAKTLFKTSSGTWVLSGTNTYTGATNIYAGTISVDSISSRLGSLATASIQLGDGASTGRLLYTGAGNETSTRPFILRSTSSGGGIIDQSGGGELKLTGTITSASSTEAKTLTLQGSTSGTGELGGVISDGGASATSVEKNGTGTWTLSGASTYTGATTARGGHLIITGKLNSTTRLTVDHATVTLGAADAVNHSATVILAEGAVLQAGNFTNTFAALTVSGNAVLAMSGTNGIITFGESISADWTGGALSITGWNGLESGGGTERVIFENAGLTAGQLAQITFVNPEGFAPGTYGAAFIGNEIVPLIPEPSVLLTGAMGTLALAMRRRRISV
ncbi:MAG: autotransporter-associated beta strand repeat-containing protein [Akkermansiaceae bacterium]|nr:autotransporter-associated beta strand repeat-containing protein [Akkermansiaceae bacterium]